MTVQINLKLHPELAKDIELLAKVLHIQKNEWIRNVIAKQVKKDLDEYKEHVAQGFSKGDITYDELVKYTGKKDADDIKMIREAMLSAKKDIDALAELEETYCVVCRRPRPRGGGRDMNGRFICRRHLAENLEKNSRDDFKLGLELVDLALKMGSAE